MSTVYVHVARNGDVLYVGATDHFETRCRQHKSTSPWWFLVDDVKVAAVAVSAADGREIERRLIEEFDPPYNVAHTAEWRARPRGGGTVDVPVCSAPTSYDGPLYPRAGGEAKPFYPTSGYREHKPPLRGWLTVELPTKPTSHPAGSTCDVVAECADTFVVTVLGDSRQFPVSPSSVRLRGELVA